MWRISSVGQASNLEVTLQEAVKDFAKTGLVHYEFDDAVLPKLGTHGPQVALYDRCLKQWGRNHNFIAFIDADEFILLRDAPNLPEVASARSCF